LQERLTSINSLVRIRATAWKIGCVAVMFAVKSPTSHPGEVS
jgi:cytochrome c oxidase assembly factor CtaG